MLKNLKTSSLLRISSNSYFKSFRSIISFGIETSCDDTAIGIVNNSKTILSDARASQTLHTDFGGIIPLVAKELHSARIHSVARNALTQSGLLSSNVPIASFANTSGEFNSKMASLPLPLDSSELNALSKLSVIGVTTRPGLHPCLFVGVNFANRCLATLVSRSADTPSLFPVHHMRAHALTARLVERSLRFPFLCLLVSGGHALLAFVRGPRAADFELLGDCADVAPGQVLDKVARRLKLKNLPGLHSLTGGAQIERVAREGKGDPLGYDLLKCLPPLHGVNMGFGSLIAEIEKIAAREEATAGLSGADVLPSAPHLCASLQFAIAQYVARRLQRAIAFLERSGRLSTYDPHSSPISASASTPLPAAVATAASNASVLQQQQTQQLEEQRVLVVSGGVASNQFIVAGLRRVCAYYGFSLVAPPPRLCSDNGVMIAWTALELLAAGEPPLARPSNPNVPFITPEMVIAREPIGVDVRDELRHMTNKRQPRINILV